MQIKSGQRGFRDKEEFSGTLQSVSAHSDGRAFLYGGDGAITWQIALSAVEAHRVMQAIRDSRRPSPPLPGELPVSEAVENHR